MAVWTIAAKAAKGVDLFLRAFFIYDSGNKIATTWKKKELTTADKVGIAANGAFIVLQGYGVADSIAGSIRAGDLISPNNVPLDLLAGGAQIAGSVAENLSGDIEADWLATVRLALWRGASCKTTDLGALCLQALRPETLEMVRYAKAWILPLQNPVQEDNPQDVQENPQANPEAARLQLKRDMESLSEWRSLQAIPERFSSSFDHFCKFTGKPIRFVFVPSFKIAEDDGTFVFEKREVEEWIKNRPEERPAWWPADKIPVQREHFEVSLPMQLAINKKLSSLAEKFSAVKREAAHVAKTLSQGTGQLASAAVQ